jgi:hypothetical protein
MKLFLLSKSNIELAKQEILSLVKNQEYEIYDNFLIIDSKKTYENRLGYCHEIYEFLFKCSEKNLEENIKKFDWNSIYKKDFYVKTKDKDKSKKLGSIISFF